VLWKRTCPKIYCHGNKKMSREEFYYSRLASCWTWSVCVSVCLFVRLQLCMCVTTFMYVCETIYLCMCVRLHLCMCVRLYLCMYVRLQCLPTLSEMKKYLK
jgi:hypothetical protein